MIGLQSSIANPITCPTCLVACQAPLRHQSTLADALGHWRFPSGKEMQGYAYILTHPGTPAVFYDHILSHHQQEISRLISLRHQKKIHSRSMIKITKAERDVYAAEIDEKIAVKIGPGYYEPSNSPKKWILAAEGKEYKVWEAS